jgi:hypothetical protein
MRTLDADVKALSHYLTDEIVNAVGLKVTARSRRVFDFFLHTITTRLSTICITTDRMIATDGFPAATGWMANHWVREVIARGAETVPPEGPLLVVSNHVGAYDVLVVPSRINRRDIKIIASDSPFFKNLPNSSRHMIYASEDLHSRMAAVRQGVRHLRAGGSLLLFGTGLIDPDPAVCPDAEKEIQNWSPSIEIFLRRVPETQLVVSIISGVVLPKWAHHPLTWLRRIDWQKRRIAEYGQVIEQLLFMAKPNITPSMSIAPPVSVEILRNEGGCDRVLPAIIARGKALLSEHCRIYGSCIG